VWRLAYIEHETTASVSIINQLDVLEIYFGETPCAGSIPVHNCITEQEFETVALTNTIDKTVSGPHNYYTVTL
jgi:hypothetical protein